MIFRTESGSLYEVDTENKAFRQLAGRTKADTEGKTPLGRTGRGAEGEWKKYIGIIGPKLGSRCVVQWETELLTATSSVVWVQL